MNKESIEQDMKFVLNRFNQTDELNFCAEQMFNGMLKEMNEIGELKEFYFGIFTGIKIVVHSSDAVSKLKGDEMPNTIRQLLVIFSHEAARRYFQCKEIEQ